MRYLYYNRTMSFSEKWFNRSNESLEGISTDEFIGYVQPKTQEAITMDGIRDQLDSGRPLNVKFGTDPTGPDLHLGHVVPIRVLDLFSRAGHNIDLVFGDFTAKVGDPSGRSNERPLLSDSTISENVSTFRDQVDKYFDTHTSNVKVSNNSAWLDEMSLSDVFEYLQETNLSEAVQRRDFRKRILAGKAISLAEAFYPTMMGIDSVELKTDIEIGGIDQLLNFQQTRKVQRNQGQVPEDVIMTPILEGTSGGGVKMSKSLGNYVPLNATPDEVYGKMMSIPDDIILNYITAFAPVHTDEVSRLKQSIESRPLEMKKQLATYLAALSISNMDDGLAARERFERRFARKEFTEDDMEKLVSGSALIYSLTATGKYKSRNEIRRLAKQGGIKLDGTPVSEDEVMSTIPPAGAIITVGKRTVFCVATPEE